MFELPENITFVYMQYNTSRPNTPLFNQAIKIKGRMKQNNEKLVIDKCQTFIYREKKTFTFHNACEQDK